ncbi:hypothetical protein Xbuh_19400 [Xanthomonas axonopodis pv. bauhiniae]|nr:hypothetical protein Xbuh_19400 [Xanthomonas axonopodis pv. bauhiniae]
MRYVSKDFWLQEIVPTSSSSPMVRCCVRMTSQVIQSQAAVMMRSMAAMATTCCRARQETMSYTVEMATTFSWEAMARMRCMEGEEMTP